MSLKKAKDLLNKAQDKTVELLNHPTTQSVSKMGAQFLQVAAHIGQANLKGPIGVVSTGVGLLNVLSNREQLSLEELLQAAGYKKSDQPIPTVIKFLVQKGWFKDCKPVVTTTSEVALEKHTAAGSFVLVFTKNTHELYNWQGMWSKTGEVPSPEFFAQELWNDMGNYISLGYEMNTRGQYILGIKNFTPYTDQVYVSEHSPQKIVDHFNTHKQLGLGRSFVLIGPPGTGKTTFSFHLAKLLGGRMVLIDPSFFNTQVDIVELMNILIACNPSLVLFDDIDSNNNIKQKFLTLFDMLRNNLKNTIVISTCNDFLLLPEALRRPGRLGRRFYFLSPRKKLRLEIVQKYSKLYNVKRDLSYLADIMDHPNFSPDYIKAMVEQSLVDNDDEIRRYVAEVRKDWRPAVIPEDGENITVTMNPPDDLSLPIPLPIQDDLEYDDELDDLEDLDEP